MVVACMSVEKEYTLDGVRVAWDFLECLAREESANFVDFSTRVGVRVVRWRLRLLSEDLTRDFFDFSSMWGALHALRVGQVFVYDLEDIAPVLEWCIHEDTGHEWKRYDKEAQRDEKGAYHKVDGFFFSELSGGLGQRYNYTIWTRANDKRGRVVTRKTSFYSVRNIFNAREAETLNAFNISTTDGDSARALSEFLTAFDALCREQLGARFLGGEKPLAMTCGGLARFDLFREMYGYDDAKTNERAFKQEHKLPSGCSAYLNKCRLMRGGICFCNPMYTGTRLRACDIGNINKYDKRSLYSSIAEKMPDLRRLFEVSPSELFERKDGYTYIIILHGLEGVLREGMPPVFVDPFGSDCGDGKYISISDEFAIFADELDALSAFYDIEHINISCLLRAKNEKNEGIARYARKWFDLKEKAGREKNGGLRAFAKMMSNSAWGQLSRRKYFPEIRHEWDENMKKFVVKQYDRNPDKDKNECSFSVLLGAYVTAYARIEYMRSLFAFCAGRDPASVLIYGDTDSIIGFGEMPSDECGAGLGKFKHELIAQETKILGKKCYYNVVSDSPLRVDFHARGIAIDSITYAICDAYGVDDIGACPADSFADAFSEGVVYPTPATLQVHGGRAPLFVAKVLTKRAEGVIRLRDRFGEITEFTTDEWGNLIEL